MLSQSWSRNTAVLLVGMSAAVVMFLLSPLSVQAGANGVATCTSVRGALLSRSDGQDWEAIKPRDPIKSGAVVVSLFEAHLVSANKAVNVELYGDVGMHGDFAVMESAVSIKANPAADLDLNLLRGTAMLTNQKSGKARVILRVAGEVMALDLQGPGTKLVITASGRHAPGAATVTRDSPATFIFAMVLKGRVAVSGKSEHLALSAPPGPALLRWDNMERVLQVVNMPGLPPQPTENEKAEFNQMCAAAAKLTDDNRIDAAVELTHSAQETDRLVGVTALGALDALPQLLIALNDPKQPDVRRHGIVVLRHWLGREPGQIKGFQNVLITQKKLSAAKVKSAMGLLVGFDDAERAQPATYEFLIDCLKYKTIAVRELAHWHLVRLAPAGKDIPFDAAAPPEQQEQTVERWRALIPPGQLPPKTQTNKTRS